MGGFLSGRTSPEQYLRQHIFVVHASPDILDLVRQLLQGASYNVTTTNFVPLNFDAIEAAQPSLLIVDLVAGEEFGWDLLAQLRDSARTSGIPLLIISTSRELLDRAANEHDAFGGDRHLESPFDIDAFNAAVAEMIGSA